VKVFEISMNVTEYVSRRLNECDTRFPFKNTLDFMIELNEILRELLTIEIVHVRCGVFERGDDALGEGMVRVVACIAEAVFSTVLVVMLAFRPIRSRIDVSMVLWLVAFAPIRVS
jgi:hypothetical protein